MAFDFSKVGSNPVKEEVTNTVKVENKVAVENKVKNVALETGGTRVMSKVKIGLSEETLGLSKAEIDNKVKVTVENINKIKDELNDTFIERENEIDMLALAFVAEVNAFFHGPAGTGKSDLVESWSQRVVNSNYFRTLMGKTTEPGEVFGPVSINAMKDDSYKVNTSGKLPEAHIAFVDEVFKSNSAVLNSLLTIMNEKLFFNDGVQEVPLISMVGASNEYMEED